LREGAPAMRQRGTAVIMAMLVLAAAATLVSGALWQQSALIRETENELAYAQARWLLRGAIDWAGVILQEDARTSSVDHRGEPWAVPLADTRLNENDGCPAAFIAGAIEDEQGKFNLRNLAGADGVNRDELEVLRRLPGRDRAHFKDLGDAVQRLRQASPLATESGLAVATRYFAIEGSVTYVGARVSARALVRRQPNRLEVLWMKEAA